MNLGQRINKTQGISIISIVAGLALTAMVTATIAQILISTNRAFNYIESVGELEANGRRALDLITRTAEVAGRKFTPSTGNTVFIESIAATFGRFSTLTYIQGSSNVGDNNSDSFTVRWEADGEAAFSCTGNVLAAGLHANAFQVSGGSLQCQPAALAGFTPIVNNIELMRVQLGVDTDHDGNVNYWGTPSQVPIQQYPMVIGIKVGIVARTSTEIKTTASSEVINVFGNNQVQYTTPNDRFLRKAFYTTIPFTHRVQLRERKLLQNELSISVAPAPGPFPPSGCTNDNDLFSPCITGSSTSPSVTITLNQERFITRVRVRAPAVAPDVSRGIVTSAPFISNPLNSPFTDVRFFGIASGTLYESNNINRIVDRITLPANTASFTSLSHEVTSIEIYELAAPVQAEIINSAMISTGFFLNEQITALNNNFIACNIGDFACQYQAPVLAVGGTNPDAHIVNSDNGSNLGGFSFVIISGTPLAAALCGAFPGGLGAWASYNLDSSIFDPALLTAGPFDYNLQIHVCDIDGGPGRSPFANCGAVTLDSPGATPEVFSSLYPSNCRVVH